MVLSPFSNLISDTSDLALLQRKKSCVNKDSDTDKYDKSECLSGFYSTNASSSHYNSTRFRSNQMEYLIPKVGSKNDSVTYLFDDHILGDGKPKI